MIYVENHPLDDWMTQKKQDIVLKIRPLDHWMTQKKRDIVLKNRPLDGWMDGFLTSLELYMFKTTHWMIG